METQGLAGLFQRKNPYVERARAFGEMHGRSGFAAPLMAYHMGKNLATSERWEKEFDKKVGEFLQHRIATEADQGRRQRIKADVEAAREIYLLGKDAWEATAGLPPQERSRKVAEIINPFFRQVDLPEVHHWFQDENGITYSHVVSRDAQGNPALLFAQIRPDGSIRPQIGVDSAGGPVFAEHPDTSMMPIKDFGDFTRATQPERPERVPLKTVFLKHPNPPQGHPAYVPVDMNNHAEVQRLLSLGYEPMQDQPGALELIMQEYLHGKPVDKQVPTRTEEPSPRQLLEEELRNRGLLQ